MSTSIGEGTGYSIVNVLRLSYDGPLIDWDYPNGLVYTEYQETWQGQTLVDRKGTGRRFVWVDGKVVEYDGRIG